MPVTRLGKCYLIHTFQMQINKGNHVVFNNTTCSASEGALYIVLLVSHFDFGFGKDVVAQLAHLEIVSPCCERQKGENKKGEKFLHVFMY